MQSGKRSVVFL